MPGMSGISGMLGMKCNCIVKLKQIILNYDKGFWRDRFLSRILFLFSEVLHIWKERSDRMIDGKYEKRLLDIKELCEYLGIGMTKARELVRGRNGFGVQIGNRWYADKKKLDRWLDNKSE